MFSRCIFCRRAFTGNRRLFHLPTGRRIAYDPTRGRLWLVCEGCHRWNLAPLEGRHEALHELERLVRDSGACVSRTANVALFAAGDLLLVRVGDAALPEQAWWRYGRELHRRKRAFESPSSRLVAYAYGTLYLLGELVGFADDDVDITWDDAPVADILRWRRFGWAAWYGRTECPHCGSTLRALRYDASWWVYPLRREEGTLEVGVPCQRCDPWTPENLYVIGGAEAENVLRRCLAYQNIAGATEHVIRDAAGLIEHSGSVDAFAAGAAEGRRCLWKMGPTGAVALEIALNETVEERMMRLDAGALEFVWRREEELARIIDEELSPRRALHAQLRRLPVRLGSPVPRGRAAEPAPGS